MIIRFIKRRVTFDFIFQDTSKVDRLNIKICYFGGIFRAKIKTLTRIQSQGITRIYGRDRFCHKKNRTYSKEFKIKCVEAVMNGEGSVDDIIARYGIFRVSGIG